MGDFSHCKKVVSRSKSYVASCHGRDLTAVPFREVNYFCIYAVDLAKDVLNTSSVKDLHKSEIFKSN